MKNNFIIVLAFATLSLAILPVAAAAGQQIDSGRIAAVEVLSALEPTGGRQSPPSMPLMDSAAMRTAQSERILESTVRLEIHRPSRKTISHATVAGGRFIITHNHYPVDFSTLKAGLDASQVKITIRKINGDTILNNAPLTVFGIAAEYPEALILDFGEIGDIGFFDYHGVPSAVFRSWDIMPIEPGSDVAQVNWDGTETFVQWTKVSYINPDPETPVVELENSIMLGASGGGVFINGNHIGNNWLKGSNYEHESRDPSLRYSVAAMNTETEFLFPSPYERIQLVPR